MHIKIKKPVVNYLEFRPSRLNESCFAHVKLLAGWLVYFCLYFVTENCIPAERFHVISCGLDDIIPFHEGFLIIYCYWYLFLGGSLLWFFLYDIPSFKRLQVYLIALQIMAMATYIIYPSIQLLRPESFARDNVLTRLMAFIYAFDTPTGVCPSCHVAFSIGAASTWCHRRGTSKAWKCFVIISVVLISISTAFVKQHSVVDIFAAIPVCLIAEAIVFFIQTRFWSENGLGKAKE